MDLSPHFYMDVPRPQRLSRGLIFIKWILLIPHSFILSLFGMAASVVGFIAWWAILITGRYPQELWELVYRFLRWNTRVSVYGGLLRDEYPPFGEAPYPLDLRIRRPDRSSRLLLFGRIFLLIPLVFWGALVGLWAAVLTFVAFFTILFTGTIPTSFWNFMVGALRYSVRVNAWAMMLFDNFPGFSLENPTA